MECNCHIVRELNQRISNLEIQLNHPQAYKMYRIVLEDYKIQVVCERCYKNGSIDTSCKVCGGKGIHNKTKQRWEVSKQKKTLIKLIEMKMVN